MSSAGSSSSSSSSTQEPAKRQLARWPVLMETDGGREVHHLQVRGALWQSAPPAVPRGPAQCRRRLGLGAASSMAAPQR
jgi:hypothetical protein